MQGNTPAERKLYAFKQVPKDEARHSQSSAQQETVSTCTYDFVNNTWRRSVGSNTDFPFEVDVGTNTDDNWTASDMDFFRSSDSDLSSPSESLSGHARGFQMNLQSGSIHLDPSWKKDAPKTTSSLHIPNNDKRSQGNKNKGTAGLLTPRSSLADITSETVIKSEQLSSGEDSDDAADGNSETHAPNNHLPQNTDHTVADSQATGVKDAGLEYSVAKEADRAPTVVPENWGLDVYSGAPPLQAEDTEADSRRASVDNRPPTFKQITIDITRKLSLKEKQRIQMGLIHAMEKRDILELKRYIRFIEEFDLVGEYREEYDRACIRLAALLRGFPLLNLDHRTIFELKRYHHPPPAVHGTLTAVFLLLGYLEEETSQWKKCRLLLDPTELERQMNEYNEDLLHPEIAARARELVESYNVNDIAAQSAGIVPVYNWVMEVTNRLPAVVQKLVPPAGLARQRQIFSPIYQAMGSMEEVLKQGRPVSANTSPKSSTTSKMKLHRLSMEHVYQRPHQPQTHRLSVRRSSGVDQEENEPGNPIQDSQSSDVLTRRDVRRRSSAVKVHDLKGYHEYQPGERVLSYGGSGTVFHSVFKTRTHSPPDSRNTEKEGDSTPALGSDLTQEISQEGLPKKIVVKTYHNPAVTIPDEGNDALLIEEGLDAHDKDEVHSDVRTQEDRGGEIHQSADPDGKVGEEKKTAQSSKKPEDGDYQPALQDSNEKTYLTSRQLDRLKHDINAAMKQRDVAAIRWNLDLIEKVGATGKFPMEYNSMKVQLAQLSRNYSVFQLNKLIDEVKRFQKPPLNIHNVLVATLLLLGYDEFGVWNWSNCVSMLNAEELEQKFKTFDDTLVSARTKVRAREVVASYNIRDGNATKIGATPLYFWVLQVTEVESLE